MLGENEDLFDFLTDEQQAGFIDFGMDSDDGRAGTAIARVKRFRRPRAVKYQYAQEAARGVGRLETGEHVEMIVSGDFISGDFFEAYMEENNLVADEMIVTTLSLSRENVDSLRNIQLSRLNGLMGLVISDYFFSNERHAGVKDIIEQLGQDQGFYLAVAGIHTKITLIKTECGMNLAFGGSSNLRSSLNIEQITIDNDLDLYAFHREWISAILNEYHVNHKMLRRERLWPLVANRAGRGKQKASGGRRSSAMLKRGAENLIGD